MTPGGLVDQLPASVVQLRRPDQVAWHSTWGNSWTLGVELASLGEVRANSQGVWCGPNDNWGEAARDPGAVFAAAGRHWENYTLAQLTTAVRVAQYYGSYFRPFWPSCILGHEHVQGVRTSERPGCDKRDAGVWLNYTLLRRCITGLQPLSDLNVQPVAGPTAEQIEAAEASDGLDTKAATQMRWLGYHIEEATGRYFAGNTTAFNSSSLYSAQRMLGLKADTVLGPKTAAALTWRVRDRFAA